MEIVFRFTVTLVVAVLVRPRSAGCDGPPGRADRQARRKSEQKNARSTICPWSSSWAASLDEKRLQPGRCWTPLKEALEGLGFSASDLFEMEPDAGLGNGGLGRLAACYLDSMTTLEIPATGYSICYELGIFKQKIVDGQQVELPDNWLGLGDAWLIPKLDEAEEVRFGGTVRGLLGRERPSTTSSTMGYTTVLAIPWDMEIAGYETDHANTLRLWDAKSPAPVDMSLFSRGEYLKAGGAAGHGRGHRQGPLPRGQPLRGQVPAPEAAVLLRLRHGAVHRAQASGPSTAP